jgi:tRNA G37 N-methylase Trm5
MIANSSRPDELVFDPFCGSGSTVVAAHQLGRVAYGCEIDPGYLAVERLIGSIRRESLDHLIVFDETQLRRVLKNYVSYYNQIRTHLSLDKMRRIFGARRSSILSQQYQSSVDSITNTSGFRF